MRNEKDTLKERIIKIFSYDLKDKISKSSIREDWNIDRILAFIEKIVKSDHVQRKHVQFILAIAIAWHFFGIEVVFNLDMGTRNVYFDGKRKKLEIPLFDNYPQTDYGMEEINIIASSVMGNGFMPILTGTKRSRNKEMFNIKEYSLLRYRGYEISNRNSTTRIIHELCHVMTSGSKATQDNYAISSNIYNNIAEESITGILQYFFMKSLGYEVKIKSSEGILEETTEALLEYGLIYPCEKQFVPVFTCFDVKSQMVKDKSIFIP